MMTHRPLRSLSLAALFAALSLAFTLGAPNHAEAQSRRAGPLFVSAGIGPSILFEHDTSFRLSGDFGWHPGGHDEGFFLAANLTFSVDAYYAQVFGGIRLGGDIEVFTNRDVAVLLTPQGLAGFGWLNWGRGGGAWGYSLLQPSFQVNVGILERVLWIWAQPVSFDFLLFPDTWRRDGSRGFDFAWGYSFLAGVRYNFG